MASSSAQQPPPPWGTLETLLLVCAVNRHGLDRWDSVASELHSRTSSAALTPLTCRDKFHDLKRLYAAADGAFDVMLDDLRRLRVEELRREVRRRDVSIVSLEMKVKKMEEDRDWSLNPPPPSDLKETEVSEKLAGKSNSCEDLASDSSSERENRSFNESNSTSQRSDAKPSKKAEPDPESDPAQPQPPSANVKVSADVAGSQPPDDVAAEKEEEEMKRSNSDVQSSASLSRKRKRRRNESGGGSSGEEVSPATTKRVKLVKLEPLFNKVLGLVRSHRLGSVFQRRLRTQESQGYKNLIREHVDLHVVQSRLDSGVYKDYTHKFFRDLLLLFSNAIVYYRKAAPEHVAALELRSLVLKEMNDHLPKAGSTVGTIVNMMPNVESDVTTTTTTSTMRPSKSSSMVACGKRGSINALSENKKGTVRKVEDIVDVKVEEKSARKRRVSQNRRGGGKPRTTTTNKKNVDAKTNESGGNNEVSAHEGSEVVKTEKKEDVKKRQQGVASFLKRMQQNGGGEAGRSSNGSEDESQDTMVDEDEEEKDETMDDEEDEKKKKTGRKKSDTKGKKERVARSAGGNRGRRGGRGQESSGRGKRGVGRLHKKQETTAATGSVKRGRDNGEADKVGSSGRLRKRTRR